MAHAIPPYHSPPNPTMFPNIQSCLICHTAQPHALCTACQSELRQLFPNPQHLCPRCGEFSLNQALCGNCQRHPPPYSAFWACAEYIAPIPALLHAWKHHGNRHLTPVFAWLLQENPPPWLARQAFDAVLAMPISRERRLQRGFNQCDSLAQAITQRYKTPLLAPNLVHRTPKAPQSTLSAAERAQNIRGAFRIHANVKNCKVVIIDDVSTTHSSIAELSRALLLSGAAEVYACVIACNK